MRLQRIDEPVTTEPAPDQRSGLMAAARHVYEAAADRLSPPRRHVSEYLGLMEGSEQALAEALEAVADAHSKEPDILTECQMFAQWSRDELESLREIITRYGEARESEPDRLREAVAPQLKRTGLGLVRDLHDCWLLAQETSMSLIVLDQAAKGLRDKEMQDLVERIDRNNERLRDWLKTRIKQAAPQALNVPP